MKLYDISQELFSAQVYPGDTWPRVERVKSIAGGADCNLTDLRMCVHNGTHMDAPFHFCRNGRTIDQVPLEWLVGEACVEACEGMVTAEAIDEICAGKRIERLLLKGELRLMPDGARRIADYGVRLLGVEGQTVGEGEDSLIVHQTLLGADMVILEGLRLGQVPCGMYRLHAAPINLGGCDGAPVRATLQELPRSVRLTTLCYIRQNGKYLMLYRNKKKEDQSRGKWLGIGGKFEPGETPDECMRREVMEETGLKLTDYHFHGVISFISDIWEGEYMFLYSSDSFEGELRDSCSEGMLKWIPENEILDLNLWEGDRIFLQEMMEGKDHINLKFVYRGDKLISWER